MPTFVRPKTPTYDKGVLVIHSDDGVIGDITHWFPLLEKLAKKYSSWPGTAVANTAVVTSTIGTIAARMTVANVSKLIKNRWEMLSHGRHHTGIGAYPLVLPVSAGATRIDIKAAAQINMLTYQYEIYEGTTSELLRFSSFTGDSNVDGFVIATTPLVNSYTTAAKIRLTDASAHELMQGCIDDAKAWWGIDIKHHVYTYHGGGDFFPHPKAQQWVSQHFISGRGSAVPAAANYPATTNLSLLKSALNSNSNGAMDALLNEVATNDGILIYYGHGESDATNLAKLEYVVEGAFSRGIRIKTMSGALKHYGLM